MQEKNLYSSGHKTKEICHSVSVHMWEPKCSFYIFTLWHTFTTSALENEDKTHNRITAVYAII